MNYPLEQLLEVKKNRFEDAIKILNQKKEILKKEEFVLKELEQERDEALRHKVDKLNQFREELDKATTTKKIEQMKYYLQVVDEELQKKQEKVNKQKKVVFDATTQVEIAKADLFQKQKDLEKMNYHKKEWEKEQNIEKEKKSIMEHDELGATSHEMKNRERKRG